MRHRDAAITELTLKGKCLRALEYRDKGDPRYGMLVMLIAQRLNVSSGLVDIEIARVATS